MAGAFRLEDVAPWGRNRVEYTAFFDLAGLLPHQRILDCAAGPSSFTAEMSRLDHLVVAADPLYRLPKETIKQRIAATRGPMMAGVRAAADRFVWDDYRSPEALEATRLSAMKHFLEDYEEGRGAGATSTRPCRRCPSTTAPSIWRFARTSCSSTPKPMTSTST